MMKKTSFAHEHPVFEHVHETRVIGAARRPLQVHHEKIGLLISRQDGLFQPIGRGYQTEF